MNANQIRQKYLSYLSSRGHKIIPPAPIILENDPTTLFTGSGMQPLMPYLLGEKHPDGNRLTDSQPCLRTEDIDDVGDNRHTTFFEMLGNWSLGAYFKEEQIRTFFSFLTEEIGLDPSKLYVTCFIGDKKYHIPKDTESAEIWQKVFKSVNVDAAIADIGTKQNGDKRGIKKGERIFFYDDQENWWSRAGGIATTPIGDPCGPDSEVFYDFGARPGVKSHPAGDDGRFIEIGNQVFMSYRRTAKGFEPLVQKNVDFGGGLERVAAAALDAPDVFQTSLIYPIIEKIEKLSGKSYESNTTDMRIMADHLRGAIFLVAAGLTPSNKEQGYVLRRLLRRAILKSLNLGIASNFLSAIPPVMAKIYASAYPQITKALPQIIKTLEKEEKSFRQTLARGLRELNKLSASTLSGKDLFKLQDTYGFPIELSVEEAYRQNIKLSDDYEKEFKAALSAQRELSQTASKGMFKGGLSDHTEMTIKYHTAAHLLLAALKKRISPTIDQKGSNITPDRLRFDFSVDHKLTAEELKSVEDQVNAWIESDFSVISDEYDTDYALDTLKAHGTFREKYPARVTVYTIGDASDPISMEICGGPHVARTGSLGHFKITKEESSSAGVRRIKAALN
jgi:alanyl-tRNA synthetase